MTVSRRRLCRFRKHHGLSQRYAARILGDIHWVTISRWEQGHTPVSRFAAAVLYRWEKAKLGRADLEGLDALDALAVILG